MDAAVGMELQVRAFVRVHTARCFQFLLQLQDPWTASRYPGWVKYGERWHVGASWRVELATLARKMSSMKMSHRGSSSLTRLVLHAQCELTRCA